MTISMPDERSEASSELSPEDEVALEDEKRLRQLSERLKEHFKETLSDPIPVELVELVDQLKEDKSEEQ